VLREEQEDLRIFGEYIPRGLKPSAFHWLYWHDPLRRIVPFQDFDGMLVV
jgi:hypothetical protein